MDWIEVVCLVIGGWVLRQSVAYFNDDEWLWGFIYLCAGASSILVTVLT